MNKITKAQLDKIKNAKTNNEAFNAYKAIQKPADEAFQAIKDTAWKAYKATKDEAYEAYDVIWSPAFEEYKAIKDTAWRAYSNWTEPKLDYSKMSKEELIEIIETKGEKNE